MTPLEKNLLKLYYTYFVIIKDDNTIDCFYECENKYMDLTEDELLLVKAIDLFGELSEEDAKTYAYMISIATHSLGDLKVFKSTVKLTKEDLQNTINIGEVQ